MNIELHEIKVRLSNDQKQEIRNTFINSGIIRLILTKDALRGCDTLLVPSQFFEGLDDAPNGIDATIDKQTKKEMHYEMWEELKFLRDKNLLVEMLKDKNHEEIREYYKLFFKPTIDKSTVNKLIDFFIDKNLSDEMLEYEILDYGNREKIWEYYGLFFSPTTDESMENKGIEFNLDYSSLNDLAKDFVKNNIKKLVL